MDVSVIGISHHTASVAAREQFSLPGELVRKLLRSLRAEGVFEEAMVLDTCNRTEVYFTTNNKADSLQHLLDHFARIKGVATTIDSSAFYRYDGKSAIEHLFRVAAALESQIVGEHQILGQIKNAYRLALEERTARFFLNKMLHRVFRVGKRIRSETQLGRGSTSVAHAAVDLARQIFSNLTGKAILLVGAGQTAELVARALMRCNVSRVIVSNRTLSRAWEVVSNLIEPKEINGSRLDEFEVETDDLSQKFQCPALLRLLHKRSESPGRTVCPSPPMEPAIEAIELGQILDVIAEVDLVICSTASPDLVLRHEELKGILHHSNRSLFIIDIAIPRDVDPKLGSLPNVYLYNLDDLDRLVAQNIDSRRQEIPRAEAIVKDEVQEFTKWLNSLQVAPTIKLLQHRFGTLQEAEIKRYGKKFCSHDREQLQKFTGGLCNKMLHQPIAFLRRLSEDAAAGDQLAAIDIVRQMFDLDCPEDDS